MVQGENREDRLMPHWQRGTGFANKKSDAWFNLKHAYPVAAHNTDGEK